MKALTGAALALLLATSSAAACDASCMATEFARGSLASVALRDDSLLEAGDPKIIAVTATGGRLHITIEIHKSAPQLVMPRELTKALRATYCSVTGPIRQVKGLSMEMTTVRSNKTTIDTFHMTKKACRPLEAWLDGVMANQ